MSKFFLIAVFTLATLSGVNAQANLLMAQKASDIGKISEQQIAADNDGPIPYGYVDDRDILWSKVVWEFIDLNQKINLRKTHIISKCKCLFANIINIPNKIHINFWCIIK